MEICRLRSQCYIVICVIVISGIQAKTFSINEALAAQKLAAQSKLLPEQQGTTADIPKRKKEIFQFKEKKNKFVKEGLGERISLNKTLTSDDHTIKTQKKFGSNIIPKGKYISPYKFRKAFQINLPLKPKKQLYKPYYKRKNQSVKREILENEKYVRRYIPLLKSIGMLFDNILNTDSIESPGYGDKRRFNKTISYSTQHNDIVCQCSACPKKSGTKKFNKNEETIAAAETTSHEIKIYFEDSVSGEVAPKKANSASFSDISVVRKDPLIPLLSSGNTTSSGRDDNGVPERSSTTRHWSNKRNITRHNRDGKFNTGSKNSEANTKDNEEYPCCDTRNSSSGPRSYNGEQFDIGRRGFRNRTRIQTLQSNHANGAYNESNEVKNSTREVRGNIANIKVQDKDEIGGDETKNSTNITQHTAGRIRGTIPENQEYYFAKPVQSIKGNASGDDDVGQHQPRDKQVLDGNGTSPKEVQGVLREDPKTDIRNFLGLLPLKFDYSKSDNNKGVVIFDGYSTTRETNSDNKVRKSVLK